MNQSQRFKKKNLSIYVMREETEKWLLQADFEIDTAKVLFDNQKFSSGSFHAQQAAEMAIKAIHVEKGKPLKGHNLLFLIKNLGPPKKINKAAKKTESGLPRNKIPGYGWSCAKRGIF